MRKLGVFILGASLSICFAFGGSKYITAKAEENFVYVGGMSAGFTLKANGAQVIGMCEVVSRDGVNSPAAEAGVRAGDTILKVGGIKVDSIAELNDIVNKCKETSVEVEVLRGKDVLTFSLKPKKDELTGRYKIGVLVRDNISGIGTVTYIDKSNKRFASLGHSVENENKQELKISNGIVYECSIVGVSKGVRGRAGELRGMFMNEKTLGMAEKLCACGIFGTIDENFEFDNLQCVEAASTEVKPGIAYIYSTVSGIIPERFEIEIVKVDKHNRDNKNYVIKVTDEKLIEETGGIVQGMSGSPILQNGKMVGAVTHVFLNDPTRGYGITIETMLRE